MGSFVFRDQTGDVTLAAPYLMRPTPRHALTDGATMAVAAVRASASPRGVDGATAGPPEVIPYEQAPGFTTTLAGVRVFVATGPPVPVDPVTSAARTLRRLADVAGFETQMLTTHDSCTVEGIMRDRRVGFRAFWKRGRTAGGSWHEPWRYATVADERPPGVNELTKTGKAGYRPPGMNGTRTVIVATPWGLALNVTDLTARIETLGSTP